MSSEDTSIRQLFRAIKKRNLYQESLIYLDVLWGLHPRKQNICANLKFWIYFITLFAFVILCTAAPIAKWTGIGAMGKTDLMGPSNQILFTSLFYKLHLNDLNTLLEDLENFWTVDSCNDDNFRIQLKTTTNKALFYAYSYKISLFFGISQYYIKPFVGKGLQLGTDWFEFCDFNDFTCFIPCLLVQYYCFFILVGNISAFDGIFASLVLRVFEQLRMIKNKMEKVNFVMDVDNKQNLQDMAAIIDHHDFILNYINKMDKFYSKILLGQVSNCIFSLCIGSFLLTSNRAPGLKHFLDFVFYLVAIFWQIFTYCFGGQVLLNECESVVNTIYSTNWWLANVKMQKTVLIVMMRSQKLGHLTVGGITDINLKAARTAFSFYTLMNQLYKKEVDTV